MAMMIHGQRCLYQGLAAVATGMTVLLTVDHGTAFDIAGKGIADERSLIEAMRQAVELATRKRDTRNSIAV